MDLETRLRLTLEFYEVFKDQIQPANTRKGDVGWYDDAIGGIQDPDAVPHHNLNTNPKGTYSKPSDMDWDLWPHKDWSISDPETKREIVFAVQ